MLLHLSNRGLPQALIALTLWMPVANAARATEHPTAARLWLDQQPAHGYFDLRLRRQTGTGPAREQQLAARFIDQGQLSLPLDADWAAAVQRGEVSLALRSSGSAAEFEAVPGALSLAAAGSCPASWNLAGNADATQSSFIGTSNGVPLRFGSNQTVVGLLQALHAGSGGSVRAGTNVALGYTGNQIGSAFGVTLLGGGVQAGVVKSNKALADFSAVLGGLGNETGGSAAATVGGESNTAAGTHSATLGGSNNLAGGHGAVVLGGGNNIASGISAATLGGAQNEAQGDNAIAAGFGAFVGHDNSWVWYDGESDAGASSSAAGQVVFSGEGGFGINTAHGAVPGLPLNAELTVRSNGVVDGNVDLQLLTSPQLANGVNGYSLAALPGGDFYLVSLFNNNGTLRYDPLLGVYAGASATASYAFNRGSSEPQFGAILQVGDGGSDGNGALLTAGGSWTNASSRAFKHNFVAVDPEWVLQRLLALPMSSWEYRDSAEGRHIGPVAEEFQQAFGFGGDAQRIATVDADGVALAAIQGLNDRLQQRNALLTGLIQDLSQRISALERQLAVTAAAAR